MVELAYLGALAKVHMQSVGEEIFAYGSLCLCLMEYGTTGKCP